MRDSERIRQTETELTSKMAMAVCKVDRCNFQVTNPQNATTYSFVWTVGGAKRFSFSFSDFFARCG